MMKVGVIADTHLYSSPGMLRAAKQAIRNTRTLDELRTLVQKAFCEVELILHAGDFVDLGVVEMLQHIAPVQGVAGNMDLPQIRHMFPEQTVLELQGVRVGLIHGDGGPQGIIDRVKSRFQQVDAIIFGHTHHPINQVVEGTLFFNPGSPTDRIFAPYNSVGLLEIGPEITGSLLRL